MAAVIYNAKEVQSPDDALDAAVYIANEAEKRCSPVAPQPQEFTFGTAGKLDDEKG